MRNRKRQRLESDLGLNPNLLLIGCVPSESLLSLSFLVYKMGLIPASQSSSRELNKIKYMITSGAGAGTWGWAVNTGSISRP